LRSFLEQCEPGYFLLIIDEITYIKDWDRVIKALADEGAFYEGLALLTGSDTWILKEAAMRFPGRRGEAEKTDFHLYPLSFKQYVNLIMSSREPKNEQLAGLFQTYLQCGGYLRAINDLAKSKSILPATYQTYEQWIRGDFLKQGKNEDTLMAILQALLTVGVGQISYSSLTCKVGIVSKETLIDYCRLLERMDILIHLKAFDSNKKQGAPRKDRKFHFADPFIYRVILQWLTATGYQTEKVAETTLIEAAVASHCHRFGRTFYFKGQGEIDIIWMKEREPLALEVKWAEQVRASDLKMLKHFKNSIILTKKPLTSTIENIQSKPVYAFLYELDEYTQTT